jgi:hypothetical protein
MEVKEVSKRRKKEVRGEIRSLVVEGVRVK